MFMMIDITPMLSSTSGILVSVIILIASYTFLKAYLTGPPGPWGLPILGYYPFLSAKFHIDLSNLAKKYGDVFVFNCAGQEYIHLNSLKAIREAHVTKADCFASRPHKFGGIEIIFGEGAGFAEGEKWRTLRKSLVQGLRHYGIGGNTSEDFKGPVLDSVISTLEELKQNDGKVVDIVPLLSRMCTWAVRQIFFGNLVTDEHSAKIADTYERASIGFSGTNMLLAGNIVKYLIFPFRKDLQNMIKENKKLTKMLHKIIDDHKPNLDPDNPRDFIDLHLIENKSKEEKNDPTAKYFTDKALVGTLVQAFGDGSFLIALFIGAFLRELSFMPEVQNKIHDEIVNVIGTERLPTWEDRTTLTYTMAVLKELTRTSSFFPANPSLECTKDTTVLGVPVTKGQVTIFNSYAVHHDPSNYEDPLKFDPERFLKDKNLSTVSFGLGKRACTGEMMVMQETFIYIASILQSFRLSTEEDVSKKQAITSVKEADTCKIIVSLRKSAGK